MILKPAETSFKRAGMFDKFLISHSRKMSIKLAWV